MNKRRIWRAALGAGLVALLVVGVVYAATIDVDTFVDGPQNLTVDDGTTTALDSAGSYTSIIGDYRDLYLEWDSGTTDDGVALDVNTTDETLVFSAKSNMQGFAEITWDGDNDASSLSYNLGEDLTDSGTNTGIHLRVVKCDHDTTLTFTGHDSSSSSAALSRDVAGCQGVEYLDLFYEFDDFGTGATWSNLGALVFKIDGTVAADLDVTVDLIEATGEIREYGDLPDGTGGTPDYTDNDNELAAYHSNPQGLTLGFNLDYEGSSSASQDCEGDDDGNFDDEDGVTPNFFDFLGTDYWGADVTVNGCSGTCYLNGWIDWNSDGDFGDSGEHFINEEEVNDGSDTYVLDQASNVTAGQYYLRFRVCDTSGECDSPSENATNGEVEDYRWYMNPTAITLTDITARSSTFTLALGAVALVAVGLLGAAVVLRRRRA